MKKLWIDDIRLPPEGWDWAKTSKEALAMVRTREYDEISFDHDLGGEDTSYPVVVALEDGSKFGYYETPIKWHIHSMNPVGRDRLKEGLRQCDKYWEELRLFREKGIYPKDK